MSWPRPSGDNLIRMKHQWNVPREARGNRPDNKALKLTAPSEMERRSLAQCYPGVGTLVEKLRCDVARPGGVVLLSVGGGGTGGACALRDPRSHTTAIVRRSGDCAGLACSAKHSLVGLVLSRRYWPQLGGERRRAGLGSLAEALPNRLGDRPRGGRGPRGPGHSDNLTHPSHRLRRKGPPRD